MKTHLLPPLLLALAAAAPAQAGTVDFGAAAGGPFSVPAQSLREQRFRATVRQEFDFSCGSAALSTLLTHHYGYPVSEQAVFEAMLIGGDRSKIQREGFSLLDMKRYLESRGFEADGFEAPLAQLAAAGLPAIALVNESGYNHFVVIKGLRDGRVLIGDPAGGTRVMSQRAFEAVWVSQIVFVISNQRQRARFNVTADWQIVPRAPVGNAVGREGLAGIVIPKLGSGDF